MLRKLATLMIFLALLVGVAACTPVPKTVEEIPRITPEDLKAEIDEGSVIVIDVRGRTSYEAAHVPGALEIPELEVKSRIGGLPRDGLIVTYCV